MGTIFDDINLLQADIERLNKIIEGDENDTVALSTGQVKPTITKAIADHFAYLSTLVAAERVAALSLSDLQAIDLSPYNLGTTGILLGEVVADVTTSNNGLYYIVGSAGTWTKSDYDLWDRVARLESYIDNHWLASSTESYVGFQSAEEIALGIMTIRGVGVPIEETYRITIFAKNDATYKDRFYIYDSQDRRWSLPNDLVPDEGEQAAGPIWIKLTGPSGYFEVLIDYTVMSDGLLLNTLGNRLVLSQQVITEGETELSSITRELTPYTAFKKQEGSYLILGDNSKIMKAVKSFYADVETLSNQYRLTVLSKADATYGYKATVYDENDKIWDSGVISSITNDFTYLECRNADGTQIILGIDFSELTTNKLYLNNVNSTWYFSGQQDASYKLRQMETFLDTGSIDLRRTKLLANNVQEIAKAIGGVRYIKGDNTTPIAIQVMAVNDGTFGYNIWITDGASVIAQRLSAVTVNPNGMTYVLVPEANSSGFEFALWIDYNRIASTGVLINNGVSSAAPLWFKAGNTGRGLQEQLLDEHVLQYHTAEWLLGGADANEVSPYLDVIKAIDDIYIENPVPGEQYDMAILTNNDPVFKTRFALFKDGVQVSFGQVDSSNENGLTEITSSTGTIKATMWVDFRTLGEGVLVNSANSPLLIDPDYVSPRGQSGSTQELVVTPAPKNLRLSIAGSSITWGSGYIGQSSYVGVVEKFLRSKKATTLLPTELSSAGTLTAYNEAMCYDGKLYKLAGDGSSVSGEFVCDEISVAIAKERGNEGASIVELYVDSILHDTFSTYNDEPYNEGLEINVSGDGSTVSWDLGYAFTFGHSVTIDGNPKVGSLNQGGYGGSIPGGDDYMIVRKTVDVSGEQVVRHFITFATAPTNGAAVRVVFNQGESIKTGRSTVGNVGKKIGSNLESSYGDGNIAYDPANPVGLSSGLDFRQTDERAILTWRFDTMLNRKFTFKIKQLDSRATGATSEFYINFVTNRMHFIQNAGIGGFKASDFLASTGLKTSRQINAFKPDHVVIESATNDDWGTGVFLAYTERLNQTAQEVRDAESSINMYDLTGAGDSYTVKSSYVEIVAIDAFSVTLDPSAFYDTIQAGDLVVLGDYSLDNRRLAVRVIDTWDNVNKVATFKKELSKDDFIQHNDLSELIGQPCQIKRIDAWVTNVESLLDKIEGTLEEASCYIGTSGIPHMPARRLEGYREKGKELAASRGCKFVDYYLATLNWTFDQVAPNALYLDAFQSVTSTGASAYVLKQSNGTSLVTYSARNLTVKVNGVERTTGFTFKGGQKKGWNPGTDPMTLGNAIWLTEELELVFTSNIPTAGSTIEVFYNSSKWASDDCHPGAIGYNLFGNAVIAGVFNE